MAHSLPLFIEKTALRLFKTFTFFKIDDEIEHFGVFGSCIYSAQIEDIDIILITKKQNMHLIEISSIIQKTTNRIHGRYNSKKLLERNLNNAFIQAINSFQAETAMDVEYGVGPAGIRTKCSPWLHLNGPMSTTMWHAFIERFPIHGQIIANNYVPIIGGQLPMRMLRQSDLIQYVIDMETRFRTIGVSAAYCRKLIKTAALLNGETSCDLFKCLNTLFRQGVLNNDLIRNFEANSTKQDFLDSVCLDLLKYIGSQKNKYSI